MAKRSLPKVGQPDRKAGPQVRVANLASARPVQAGPPVALAAPQLGGPSAEAISLFELGMQALQRHRYLEAADQFRALLQRFPNERGLRDRSHVYLDLCDREARQRPAAPVTIEERLTAATAALNDDDEAGAEALARDVLAEAPRQDLALYLIAAVTARRGDVSAALDALTRAVTINPEISAQARHDADFDNLRDVEAFHRLLDLPAGSTASRGLRRGRVER